MHFITCTESFYLLRNLIISHKRIDLYGDASGRTCIILIGESADDMSRIVPEESSGTLILNIAVEDWNRELSPWNAPPSFGKEPFGGGADDLLFVIEKEIIPFTEKEYGPKEFVLAGYSLAGLFALYSVYRSGLFKGAVSVSPSVWFPGWKEFISDKRPNAEFIYLSLGDKEEKTKNTVMRSVGDNIRFMHKNLLEQGIETCLEWNEGGHFADAPGRIRKGIETALRSYVRKEFI